MTGDLQAATYARVSTDQQADANTIESQVAALRARVQDDGLALPDTRQFSDEGYSGATLVRPGLERLRDQVAAGEVDRLYVHSPDRLARKYAYQVLLVDEFRRAGVEVVFLNRALGQTPEDDLLLQVQGMVAEYERAKILERSRRGKRHAAQAGSPNVLSCAPYGYHYVGKYEGGGRARFEVIAEEALVVQRIFEWVGQERATIGEVSRRLGKSGARTRTGKTVWDRATVWGMLKNPAYKGLAAFGKTRVGPMQPRLRAQRGQSEQPRRAQSVQDVPSEDWIMVPVPALVAEDLFEAVQVQLVENKKQARQRLRGARYLLQGLVCCKACGYAFYGKAISHSARKGNPRHYAYYRCIGTDAYRFGGQRICHNGQVRTDLLEEAVWQEVCSLLENPRRLEQEYRRRLNGPEKNIQEATKVSLELQSGKLRIGIGRLIDSYADGLLEKCEFEPRLKQLRQRAAKLDEQFKQIVDEAAQARELQLLVGRLEDFAQKLNLGLDQASWDGRREMIRALVKRVEIDKGKVGVVFRVDPGPFEPSPLRSILQDCKRGNRPPLGRTFACSRDDPALHIAGSQPFADQAQDERVGDAMGNHLP